MFRKFLIIGVVIWLVWPGAVPVGAKQNGCGGYEYFLPQMFGGGMAQVSALESIEKLVRSGADFPFDGRVVEVFPESVTVRVVGSDQVKRNVPIPDHIPTDKIRLGMAVRLGEHLGQPILLAILPQLDLETNYAGLGNVLPQPPAIAVIATRDGWLVSWPAVANADRYRVYRNDVADETTPDDLGYVTTTSIVVPYESPYIYFAARACSGLNESELSGWLTDNTPPPVPNTFTATNDVAGHRLAITVLDAALNDVSFKSYEIEQANDDSGAGAVSLGEFGPADFPMLRPFGIAAVKYYRIRSLDWAGNASAWSSWDYAYAGQQEIEDKFDGYGGSVGSSLESLWWLKLNSAEVADSWTPDSAGGDPDPTITSETAIIKEGAGAKKSVPNGTNSAYSIFPVSFDLGTDSRFAEDDFIVFSAYLNNAANTDLRFLEFLPFIGPDTVYVAVSGEQTGWNHFKFKKSEFSPSGFFWTPIVAGAFDHRNTTNNGDYLIIDDVRIVKADPDNPNDYNDTGKAWDKAASTGTDYGEWHVYEGNRTGEPGKPFSYGQIKTATSPAVWYLSHKPLETTQITTGTVQAGVYLKGTDGQAGLAFFVKDVTPGSWDMYAVEVDTAANQIRLVRWVGGTRTQISAVAFTSSPNTLLWLGVDLRDYDADGGRLKVFASFGEGNLIQAANMIISAQDTNVGSGGSVGLLSYQANVRFVNFVAGSPEHAAVADVARALDGPIVAGDTKRVRYNTDLNRFEYSPDGSTWIPITSPAIGARVYNNAAITLTTATWTALTFNSEEYDHGGLHSTSSNTGRLTAPVAGIYNISLLVTFAANTNAQRGLRIRHQGSTDIAIDIREGVGGSNYTHAALSTLFKLAAGEYVTAEAYQNSGGNLDVAAIATYSPNFSMQLIAPV